MPTPFSAFARFVIPICALFCLSPLVSSAEALLLGIFLAMTVGNPLLDQTRKLTPRLLALSVVGLGAGMNLNVVGKVGAQGVGYTLIGISSTLLLGTLLENSWARDEARRH